MLLAAGLGYGKVRFRRALRGSHGYFGGHWLDEVKICPNSSERRTLGAVAGHLDSGRCSKLLRGALCPSLLFLAASCLQIGLPEGADGGAPDAAKRNDGGAPSDAKAPERDASGDFGCVIDPLSRVTLCTGIGLCPGLSVDHDRFPNCGFRAGTALIDVQCFCDNFLCPLGGTLTCGQARELLATQFELTACSQVSEGRCARRSVAPPTGTSCDKNCAAICAGDPGCLRLCGC